MSDNEKQCDECGHGLSMHFVDVLGVARCLTTTHGVSARGVMGIPYSRQCDCANFKSPTVAAQKAREAEEKAKRDEWARQVMAEVNKVSV